MTKHLSRSSALATLFTLALPSTAALAAVTPHPGLYTSYSFNAGQNELDWMTCGYDKNSEGCYGFGNLGPFGHLCSVAAAGGKLYVADSAALENHAPSGRAALYVYEQVVSATPSVKLLKVLPLPIAASQTAQCSMGVLGNTIYFGTDQANNFYLIDRTAYTYTANHMCDPPAGTTLISINRNYAVVNQGTCVGYYQRTNGLQESGGESAISFLPTANGIDPQP